MTGSPYYLSPKGERLDAKRSNDRLNMILSIQHQLPYTKVLTGWIYLRGSYSSLNVDSTIELDDFLEEETVAEYIGDEPKEAHTVAPTLAGMAISTPGLFV